MPAGQRDQSAAALPICGGLETTTARLTVRVALGARFGPACDGFAFHPLRTVAAAGEYELLSSTGIARGTSYASVARVTTSAR